VQLRLTRRGERLLERAPLAAQDRLIRGIERLKPASRARLAGALHELVSTMQLTDHAPVMFFEEDQPAAQDKRAGRKKARAISTGRSRRESARAQPE
jgi:hypothetical protein